jgi:hypothetical protein
MVMIRARNTLVSLFVTAVVLLLSTYAAAASPVVGGSSEQTTKPAEELDPCKTDATSQKCKENAAKTEANKGFLGTNFGMGVGFSYFGGEDVVREAEVVDGIVRVTKGGNTRPRLLLESHYFFAFKSDPRVLTLVDTQIVVEAAKWGIGPFATVQGSGDEVIEAFGAGAMVGLRRADNSSFNLGVGFLIDPGVQRLGDGIVANEPLPDGETEIRYVEESRWGLCMLVSFSF